MKHLRDSEESPSESDPLIVSPFLLEFLNWLLSQCDREDSVGELARDYRNQNLESNSDNPILLTHSYLLNIHAKPETHAVLDQARAEYRLTKHPVPHQGGVA